MAGKVTAPRLPWYDHQGISTMPYVIGISGGSGSGKTSIANKIIEDLGIPWVTLLSMDSFYKSLTDQQRDKAYRNEYDFDHPSSFDYDILYDTLVNLKKGIKVDIPMYDFSTHSRYPNSLIIRLVKTESLYGANVIIFEGIFSLYDEKVRDLLDLKVFVACDDDVRLTRRLKRDISERGRDLNGVLHQYHQFVKPSYDKYIKQTMDFADIVLPKGIDSQASMDLLVQHVLHQHLKRSFNFKALLNSISLDDKIVPPSVHVLDKSPILLSYVQKLKNDELSQEEFSLISDNLVVLLLRYVFCTLQKTGKEQSIISGIFMDRSLPISIKIDFGIVFPNAPVGKVCIQHSSDGGPALYLCEVPDDIHNGIVVLFDAKCSSGAAAVMAIRVILDHNVMEENIVFCSLVCSRASTILIHNLFPKVIIVTCEMEDKMKTHEFPVFSNSKNASIH